jgi:hypothetical protein
MAKSTQWEWWNSNATCSKCLQETETYSTPEDVHKWTKEYITGITFFYITQKEIKAHILRLTAGLQFAKSVPGT